MSEGLRSRPVTLFLLCVAPFVVLATLNSSGYRFGASDQAFYLPAIYLQLDPELFPRDASVLTAQTSLTPVDDVIAWVVATTGVPLPFLFVALYLLTLVLLAWGVWRIGTALYEQTWTVVALLAALTLRHAVAKTGTNTLEGYFHPRVLVFAVGVIAVSSFLRGRVAAPLVLLAAAGTIHPTTALWFLVWLAVAAVIARPGIRRHAGAAAIAAAFAGLWAVTAGPLAGHLAIMDAEWRQILEPKDYLFPLQWPLHAWVLNLGYLLVVGWIYVMRSRAGCVSPLERALVLGSASLVLIFAGALVLHGIGIVLSIQLQPARVFWMFDLLATIYGVWALAEGGALRTTAAASATASLLVAFSVVRGGYALATNDRPAIQVSIPDDDWGRAMTFVRSTAKDSSWLADPMHAALYGTSLRLAGRRDVFVEALKDSAIGMYDRDVAVRTEERWARVRTFLTMTTEEFRALARDYDLDFMITELHLDFPLVYQSGSLRIYRLK